MAIQVNVKSENGILLNYHMIAAINIELNQRATIVVQSYLNEEGRQYDKDYALGKIVGEPTFPYTNMEYLGIEWEETIPLLSGDLIQNAYEWLKKQPTYAGAIDV